MNPGKLPRSFYQRPTLTVAEDLLGKILVRRWRKNLLAGRIVEVEAYLGDEDPASHAFRGRTPRNDVMFWNGGHLYVYFTYGMHYCANIVTEKEGRGCAVLLRALEPLEGMEAMARARGSRGTGNLCNGPARLCQAFRIARPLNGADLCGATVWIAENRHSPPRGPIRTSPRIGITSGTRERWRLFLADSPFLSRT
jgi:DNA-3-methyladenine glycosylase